MESDCEVVHEKLNERLNKSENARLTLEKEKKKMESDIEKMTHDLNEEKERTAQMEFRFEETRIDFEVKSRKEAMASKAQVELQLGIFRMEGSQKEDEILRKNAELSEMKSEMEIQDSRFKIQDSRLSEMKSEMERWRLSYEEISRNSVDGGIKPVTTDPFRMTSKKGVRDKELTDVMDPIRMTSKKKCGNQERQLVLEETVEAEKERKKREGVMKEQQEALAEVMHELALTLEERDMLRSEKESEKKQVDLRHAFMMKSVKREVNEACQVDLRRLESQREELEKKVVMLEESQTCLMRARDAALKAILGIWL